MYIYCHTSTTKQNCTNNSFLWGPYIFSEVNSLRVPHKKRQRNPHYAEGAFDCVTGRIQLKHLYRSAEKKWVMPWYLRAWALRRRAFVGLRFCLQMQCTICRISSDVWPESKSHNRKKENNLNYSKFTPSSIYIYIKINFSLTGLLWKMLSV